MFLDACAIVSILADETTASAYEAALEEATDPFTSPLAAWEAIIILSTPTRFDCSYSSAETVVVEWLEARNIVLREALDPKLVLSHAVAVAEQHKVGKRHLSNFDCFHYAYAKAANAPLLTLDEKLRQTDVMTLPS